MSVSLREVLEGAGYDFTDIDDLVRISNLLGEAYDLREEVEDQIDQIEARETLENGDWYDY